MPDIGTRIKFARISHGWTQEELAGKMGYKSKSTINKIELGINDLTQSRVLKLAEVLGVTPGYLMGWEDQPEDLGALAADVLKDPQLLGLVKNYLLLDEADRGTLSAVATGLAGNKKKADA